MPPLASAARTLRSRCELSLSRSFLTYGPVVRLCAEGAVRRLFTNPGECARGCVGVLVVRSLEKFAGVGRRVAAAVARSAALGVTLGLTACSQQHSGRFGAGAAPGYEQTRDAALARQKAAESAAPRAAGVATANMATGTISPGRLAEIRQTTAFPFPKGFSR